ncbi:MAG TPA: S-adenosylmethionine:tRNA ribosyltransferase-isomerase, partial [Thermodesulfobacteriota bacterium]|nr:S-adenosylmethionine:tRNA ribosyltransferase-isomerase [Thermodesulfobacteriota bacterium]
MLVDAFDYSLPKELIAQTPALERDESRLMVVHRLSGQIEHRFFYDLPEYLNPGDLLVLNNTRVRSARLFGHKETGGAVEVLLLKPSRGEDDPDRRNWEALLHSRKKLRPGSRISVDDRLTAEVLGQKEDGIWEIRLEADGCIENLIEKLGYPPLPPYIKREKASPSSQDRSRYQTVFAARTGSAAAPTAGLHFTDKLLATVTSKGIGVLTVTLHVGLGTFQPVRVKSLEDHHMHREHYEVESDTARILLDAQRSKRRVIACGTTSV